MGPPHEFRRSHRAPGRPDGSGEPVLATGGRRARAAAWVPLLGLLAGAAPPLPRPVELVAVLRPGQPQGGSLMPGERKAYGLDCRAGSLLRIVGEQHGVDLELRLLAADDRVLAVADDYLGLDEPELLLALAPPDGGCRLEVAGVSPGPAGAFALRLTVEAEPGAEDRQALATRQELRAERDRLGAALDHLPAAPGERLAALEGLATAARALRDRLPAGTDHAFVENLLGRLERSRGNATLARAHFEAARAGWVAAGNAWGETTALHNRGLLAAGLDGAPAEAVERYREALSAAERARDPRLEAGVLVDLGVAQRRLGRAQDAIASYRRAIELARAVGDLASECLALDALGTAERYTGAVSTAITTHTASLEVCARAGDDERRALILNNLAVEYQDLGELGRTLEALDEAASLAQRLSAPMAARLVALNRGNFYLQLGKWEDAAASYAQAVAGGEPARGDRLESEAELQIGWLRLQQGDGQAALTAFAAAGRGAEQLGDSWLLAAALHSRGVAERHLGLQNAARDHLEVALARRQVLGDDYGVASTAGELSEVLRDLGDDGQAAARLDAALAISRELADPSLRAVLLWRRARLARDSGDLAAARGQIDEAIALFETVRSRLDDPELRASLLGLRRSLYELKIDILLRLDQQAPDPRLQAEAFATAERSRSRWLLELLAEARVDLRSELPAPLAAAEREAESTVAALERQWTRLRRQGTAGAAELAALRAALATAEETKRAVEREIRRSAAHYAALRYPEPIDLAATQALLAGRGRTAFLEYSLGSERSFLFVVRAGDLRIFVLPPAGGLENGVQGALAALEAASFKSRREVPELGYELFQELLAPAATVLAEVDRLVVSADGPLLRLPFEALVVAAPQPGERPRWALDRWTVSYAPSATVLATLAAGPVLRSLPASLDLVAFGDPLYGGEAAPAATTGRNGSLSLPRLPFSGQEVDEIAALFPPRDERTRLFVRGEATEENVKTSPAVAAAAHLHFALHTLTDERDADHFGLALSPPSAGAAAGEDGILELREIFQLKLSAQLVVLSACRSALGEEVRGEGLVGLSRGFMYAGAPAVLASLWEVDDRQTADLMVELYRGLAGGEPKAEALRRAKQSLAEADLAPRYWAPFVLLGDPW